MYKVGKKMPYTFCGEKCYQEYEERYLKEWENKK